MKYPQQLTVITMTGGCGKRERLNRTTARERLKEKDRLFVVMGMFNNYIN